MSLEVEVRRMRAKQMLSSGLEIKRLSEFEYSVPSQSGNGLYEVRFSTLEGWTCNCPDFVHRKVQCKHIWAVDLSLAIREEVQARTIEPITDIHTCLYCNSLEVVKDGLRHNKYGDLQIWNCKSCGRYFTINLGFERMKHSPQGVTTAMQLYFSGESLRNTAKSLRLLGVQVSHKTVFMWIKKYTALMEKYLDKITPQVGDVWRADELFLKVRGDMKYLYALMDDETRFWIAQEVANTKFTADVRPLFANGKRIAGKAPKYLITDGAGNFHEAYMKEFRTPRFNSPRHVREIRMAGRIHNNKMERLNGEIRDREKVMRSIKKTDTPILTGYQIFHNYIRPHEALEGKTPAEKAGIEVRGKDKWLTIIQNAGKKAGYV